MSRKVVYSSPFIPPEWIAAHGLVPLRLRPTGRGPLAVSRMGCCPFMSAFAGNALAPGAADAIIVAATCDQMRRGAEWLTAHAPAPVFTINVPATCQGNVARNLYREELERLGRFLVSLGGSTPIPATLADIMLHHDEQRWALRRRAEISASNVPIALVGGPLRTDDEIVPRLIENAGGGIILDATEGGERTLPAPFDPAAAMRDPLAELVRAYFDTIPDVFRRPNGGLYAYLEREFAARSVQAAVLVRCVWCDLWRAEANRLKEKFSIPMVEVEVGGEEGDIERMRTRIESLLECLR